MIIIESPCKKTLILNNIYDHISLFFFHFVRRIALKADKKCLFFTNSCCCFIVITIIIMFSLINLLVIIYGKSKENQKLDINKIMRFNFQNQ